MSNTALSDLADVEAAFDAVARVLRPGGWLGLASIHPCFEPPGAYNVDAEGRPVGVGGGGAAAGKVVGRYFDEGCHRRRPDSLLADIGFHRRRLTTIFRALVAAGFSVVDLDEPAAPPDVVNETPIYGQVAEVLVLLARLPSLG